MNENEKLQGLASITFLAIITLTSFFIYTHWITFGADDINFFNMSFSITKNSIYSDVVSRTVHGMEALGFSKDVTSIVAFRHDFQFNYPLYVILFTVFRHMISYLFGVSDYVSHIYDITSLTLSTVHLSVGMIAVFFFIKLKENRQRYAAIVALCFFCVMMLQLSPSFPIKISPGAYWRVAESGQVARSLSNMMNFFLAPGKSADIFGYTPRNTYALLLLPVFFLRWRGDIPHSYVLLLAGCFLHLTYGIIGMAMILAADIITRPTRLRDRKIIFSLLFVSLLNLSQSGYWSNIGGTSFSILAIISLFSIFILATTEFFERQTSRIGPIQKLREMKVEYADLCLFVVMALALCIVSICVSTLFTGNFSKYVIAELAGRPLALMRIPIILGLGILIIDLFGNYGKYAALAGGWATIALLVAVLAFAPNHVKFPTEAAIRGQFLEKLAVAREQKDAALDEMLIQYAISCEAAGRCDLVRRMEAFSGKPPMKRE